MYDSVSAQAIPTTAELVAGYIDGPYQWSDADWQRFPNSVKVRIAIAPWLNDGHVLDVEHLDATPKDSVGWVKTRRAAGDDPTIYCGLSNLPQVKKAFRAADEPMPHIWLAWWDGKLDLPQGSVAHQYASEKAYDLSVVADVWPGVDQSTKSSSSKDPVSEDQAAKAAVAALGTLYDVRRARETLTQASTDLLLGKLHSMASDIRHDYSLT